MTVLVHNIHRILYVGSLGNESTAEHRCRAFSRLGFETSAFDTNPYMQTGKWLSDRVRLRTLVGPSIVKLNDDLLRMSESFRPDLIWFDKALSVRLETLKKLRSRGAFTVHYNPDNPFGNSPGPGWRLFLSAIPEYDLHVVPRQVNLSQYRAAGAKDVRVMYFAYEPTIHFPPSDEWSESDRIYDVTFIGSPHDERAKFLSRLHDDFGIKVKIWGSHKWPRLLSKQAKDSLWMGGSVFNASYRGTIWRSKISLGFLTHSNCDELAHRAFEICACGGFLLAEESAGHRKAFDNNKEAVYFDSVESCAMQIKRYLPDEKARVAISRSGHLRAVSSGYSNDARIEEVIRYICK